MQHVKYPSIEQFRNAITNVRNFTRYAGKDEQGNAIYNTDPLPVLKYTGTVKLHGTNAAVVVPVVNGVQGDMWCQSRERIITPTDDNAGFASFVFTVKHLVLELFKDIMLKLPEEIDQEVRRLDEYNIGIYGEWCGGNIQGKVALNQLPKMFVILGVKVGSSWLPKDVLKTIACPDTYAEHKIYNIYDFPTYEIEIDFNQPELVQNKLIELTMAVEEHCPVCKQLGVTDGILTGEGIVFSPDDPKYAGSQFRFKSKGEKHQNSKVKTIVAVDMEKVNSINECVDRYLTETRLEQGIDKLRELGLPCDNKSTGDYIKWVVGDVIKEHGDEILMSGLTFKEVSPKISGAAKNYYFDYLNKLAIGQ
mgnify:FL=1